MLSVGGEACRSSRVQTTLFSKVKKRSGNQKKAGRPVFDISEHLSLLMPAEEWCNQFCWGVNAIFWQVLIVWCLSSDALSTVYLFLTVADIIFEDLQLYICVCAIELMYSGLRLGQDRVTVPDIILTVDWVASSAAVYRPWWGVFLLEIPAQGVCLK